jgi:hypothetical protein
MIGWLWRVLVGSFGCEHKWLIHAEIPVYASNNAKRPMAREYHLKCERCGTMTRKSYTS